jgi:hypothetical protein
VYLTVRFIPGNLTGATTLVVARSEAPAWTADWLVLVAAAPGEPLMTNVVDSPGTRTAAAARAHHRRLLAWIL